MLDPSIPMELREALDRELDRGERIVWTGTPHPCWFTPASTAMFLFAIPWTAFAVFWVVMAGWATWSGENGGSAPSYIFPLFGVPFILVGLGMLSSPIWTRRRMGRTLYAITDRRAIVFERSWSLKVRSFKPDRLRDLSRKERRNGCGDILFIHNAWNPIEQGQQMPEQVGFLRIERPLDVERLLRNLAESTQQMIPE